MARCAAPAPGLVVIMVVLLMFSPAQLVLGCITLGDPCGPAYWCCDCDPDTNYKLTCSMVWDHGAVGIRYVCSTYAFDPTCNDLGYEEGFGLPRKLGFSANQQQKKVDASNASNASDEVIKMAKRSMQLNL